MTILLFSLILKRKTHIPLYVYSWYVPHSVPISSPFLCATFWKWAQSSNAKLGIRTWAEHEIVYPVWVSTISCRALGSAVAMWRAAQKCVNFGPDFGPHRLINNHESKCFGKNVYHRWLWAFEATDSITGNRIHQKKADSSELASFTETAF